MKPEKKGQLIGGTIGLLIGSVIAYMLWGFSPPGGILILAGFAIGGLIGFNLGRSGESKRKRQGARDESEGVESQRD